MTHSTTETKTRSQPKPRIHQVIATVRHTALNAKFGTRGRTNDQQPNKTTHRQSNEQSH